MSDPLIEILTLALAAVAIIVVLALASNLSRLRKRLAKAGISLDEVEGVSGAETAGNLSPELIAVITAAIAAASGLGMNEFRVVGVNRVEGSGSWNTPIWGHIDRLIPRSNLR